MTTIIFIDLKEKNQAERQRLRAERNDLKRRKQQSGGVLRPHEEDRLRFLEALALEDADLQKLTAHREATLRKKEDDLTQSRNLLDQLAHDHDQRDTKLRQEATPLRTKENQLRIKEGQLRSHEVSLKEAQAKQEAEIIAKPGDPDIQQRLAKTRSDLTKNLADLNTNSVELGKIGDKLTQNNEAVTQLNSVRAKEEQERARIERELQPIISELNGASSKKKLDVVDPVFLKVREVLASMRPPEVRLHDEGSFGDLNDSERVLAAVYGILSADNQTNTLSDRFVEAISSALGEYTTSKELFDLALDYVAEESVGSGKGEVRSDLWAAIVRELRADSVDPKDRNLKLLVGRALGNVRGIDDGAPSSAIVIDLPDLEEAAEVEIQTNNLHAAQALYYGAMLEELRLWEVVEKMVELFQYGMLPLGRGEAGNRLYRRWRTSAERISEVERRNMYARVFGFPGGDVLQGNVNRDFQDLWLRFVSSISAFVRQFKVDSLLRSDIPVTVSQELVRKAGRDLAANLSLHTYGMAYSLATDIQAEVKEFISLLSDPEIKAAYGARDMWQVIDQVSTLELAGARNSIRYRTMANAGAIIIRWLANRADKLASTGLVNIIDLHDIRNPPQRNGKATVDPTDYDLVSACEQWLAVTGTPDMQVEEYAQPSESPTITSGPVRIPEAARDLLASVGVQASVPAGVRSNGNGRGYSRY
jgi:hypothetical protein